MDIKDNPYIQPFDYLEGYRRSAESLRYDKNLVDLERLCYQTFESNRSGKKLLSYLKDTILCSRAPGQIGKSFDHTCIYYEGYREAIRMMVDGVESYKRRLAADEQAEIQKQHDGD